MDDEATRRASAHANERGLELLKATVNAGESGAKTLLLINGGAAVALLAFLGNLATRQQSPAALRPSVPWLTGALGSFVLGVLLVGGVSLARYASLYAAMEGREAVELQWTGRGVAFAHLALLAFIVGGVLVVVAMQ